MEMRPAAKKRRIRGRRERVGIRTMEEGVSLERGNGNDKLGIVRRRRVRRRVGVRMTIRDQRR